MLLVVPLLAQAHASRLRQDHTLYSRPDCFFPPTAERMHTERPFGTCAVGRGLLHRLQPPRLERRRQVHMAGVWEGFLTLLLISDVGNVIYTTRLAMH